MKWHFIWQKAPNIQWAFSREIMVFQLRLRDYSLVIAYGEACTYEDAALRSRVSFGGSK